MALPMHSRESYTVGIICALDVDKAAMEAMLDEEHRGIATMSGDDNSYTFGRIGQHDVVIACLPAGMTGKASAATVAKDMMRSFPSKAGFMVGIGGGVWSENIDVRLGDVVVSQPDGMHGGVVQWDFGKMETEGFRRTGTLNKPPRPLLNAVQSLKATHRRRESAAHQHFKEMIVNNPVMKKDYSNPGREHDKLFEAYYSHPSGETCANCDWWRLTQRSPREDDKPRIHYGNIASGDEVVKDGPTRDRIAQEEGILCFEMEAAGLMDSFPCVVIRGVCDYADSHKNKRWQPYAAATAACYCKELLGVVQPQGIAELDLASSANYRIPFSLKGIPVTDHFVQREEEMKQLEAFFQPTYQPITEPTSQPAGRKVFVVHGLGGMGKTQLCVEFARKHKTDFSAILWLDGSSQDALRQSLASAFLRLRTTSTTPSSNPDHTATDLQESINGLLQWLSLPNNTSWLLIFDNVDRDWQSQPRDEQAYDYLAFSPSADHGSILVTTRLSRLQRPLASLHLHNVDDRCGREMLETRAGKQLPGVEKLLDKLGGLPLALVQAGAYLRQTNMSMELYLESYERSWTTLMEFQDQHAPPDYKQRNVLTTWKMSYEQVRAVDQQAAALLDLWAFLDAGDIWYELAIQWPQERQEKGTVEYAMAIATDRLRFRHSLGVLSDYSLIVADIEGRGFSIHPVVHAWCLHNVVSSETREQLCERALVLVRCMIPSEADGGHWNIARRLLPHARAAAARHLDGAEKEDFNDEIVEIAVFLNDWASSADVEALYLRVLRGYVKVSGEDHASTLEILNNIGVLYAEQGRMKEAEEMYWRALRGNLEAWVLRYTPTSMTTTTLDNLGRLYADQGKMKEAEEMHLRALSIGEKVWGPVPATTTSSLITIKNLGILYTRQGRTNKAVEMCMRALQGFEERWSPKDPVVLRMVSRLGSLYANQGKYEEAEEMYTRALQGLEEARRAKHWSTLNAVLNLANLYNYQGKYEEAEEMHMRACKGFEEMWGPKDKGTLNAVRDLGIYYRGQGRYKEAERMYVRVLEGFEEMCGLKHRTTLRTVHKLGTLYHKQGELFKARTVYTRAAEGYEHTAGDNESDIHELQKHVALLEEDECRSTPGFVVADYKSAHPLATSPDLREHLHDRTGGCKPNTPATSSQDRRALTSCSHRPQLVVLSKLEKDVF
ncbi:hypothetical protein LTR56_010356 [Elasticomyces elasticus]|nr:hypothetical protein LTR56_010356 [Elasticomyces elasticus]KAK3656924.1 hypothetical protein LTR22_009586 [Elasticomyces elasticus]KAK4926073.1 hypothetical protein LTR49_006988 [Elasticomyces elasticus]KAK5766156.1 hypothetical protein LTS12_003639 [Elasticomyces elasticus]